MTGVIPAQLLAPPEPGKQTLLFVYGTLKRGGGLHAYLEHDAQFLSEGTIPGRLFDLGWYPGYRRSEAGVVHGELFEIPEYRLSEFDRVEGAPGLYRRIQQQVTVADTPEMLVFRLAWVYEYARKLSGEREIPGGVWPVGEKIQ